MKDLIRKKIKLIMDGGDKNYFYSGIITEVTNTHITFHDDRNNIFTFRKTDIRSIKEVKE